MAQALKDQFDAAVAERLAASIGRVWPAFDRDAFLAEVLDGFAPLSLTERGWRIAHALRHHLPADYAAALDILLDSLGPPLTGTAGSGMAPFFYLPHTCFVAAYGLDHFEPSMAAQHALTQRFTAEFSIRAYLERHPAATLARLAEWAGDPNPHVRRLVSEGTRPRLPWAPRLRDFQRDPRPVLALLERLKDDPEAYVRRSVANNLNDIGKDHPDLLIETVRRWSVDAPAARQQLIRHALRSAIKRGDADALAVIGCGEVARVEVMTAQLAPAFAAIGGAVRVAFALRSTGPQPQRLQVDFRIHFVKARGETRPKVFKLRTIDLAPGETAALAKTVSLAELTTRRHYPGTHRVEALINGAVVPLGTFELRAA